MRNIVSDVKVLLDGKVVKTPAVVSRIGNKPIYRILVDVKRRSGVVDTIKVLFQGEQTMKEGDFYHFEGDIRTLNAKKEDIVLDSYVYAKKLVKLNEEPSDYANEVHIRNANFYQFVDARKTFNGSNEDVAMYRIKLTRLHSRVSFFRVTSWGGVSKYIAKHRDSIDLVDIGARMQSYTNHRGTLCMNLAAFSFLAHDKGGDKDDKIE